jgi:hypothetical protein
MNEGNWRMRALAVFLAAVAVFSSEISAQAAPAKGECWAVLIGIGVYQVAGVPNLSCTVNDVKKIGSTLKKLGGYDQARILEMTDESSERFQPCKANIEREVAQILKKVRPGDTVFLYFSGHGFLDADGRLYLAANDCDPSRATETGVRVQWLRELLDQCPAALKLLVLDACHAGSEKGAANDSIRSIPTKSLEETFKDAAGVYTLASSKASERSLIWEAQDQSLFSYWLNLGLRGHADQNADGRVTAGELYDYIHRNVTAIAEKVLHKPQTPVRSVGTDLPGEPVVICPKPVSLKEVLSEMAELLASTVQQEKVACVGLTEFSASTTDVQVAADQAGKIGSAGRYCAAELEQRLKEMSKQQFGVVPCEALQNSLVAKGLTPAQIQTVAAKNMVVEQQPVAGIGRGTVCLRTGRVMTIQCELIDTKHQEILATVGGTAQLSESDWIAFGGSAQVSVQPDQSAPPPPAPSVNPTATPATSVSPSSNDPVANLDQLAANQRHPLEDPNFPYRVQIMVNGEDRVQRYGLFRGNDLYVPLHNNETFQIWVENRTDDYVWMRLLVDGLNTVPERVTEGGRLVEKPCQRVLPSEARPWQLRPKEVNAVKGYYSQTGENGRYNEFKVVRLQDSVIRRDVYSDQLGLISAAFYSAKEKKTKPNSRGIPEFAIDPGQENTENVENAEDLPIGDLQAVVNIHYVSFKALEELKKPGYRESAIGR